MTLFDTIYSVVSIRHFLTVNSVSIYWCTMFEAVVEDSYKHSKALSPPVLEQPSRSSGSQLVHARGVGAPQHGLRGTRFQSNGAPSNGALKNHTVSIQWCAI